MADIQELDIPDGIDLNADAHELVRFWVSEGQDHVSLCIGLFEADDEPNVWGSIAADIMRHAVNGMVQEDPGRNAEALLAEIERAFATRLKETTDYTGQLSGDTH